MRALGLIILFFLGTERFLAQEYLINVCNKPEKIHNKNIFDDCIHYKKDKFNFREALRIAQEGMRKFPYNYDLRLDKALIYENLGNDSAAENELIGLIRLYPEKQELHNYLGRIYYNKDRSKALLALLSSIKVDPSSNMSKSNIVFVRRLLDGRVRAMDSSDKVKFSAYTVDDFDDINLLLSGLPTEREISLELMTQRLQIFFKALAEYEHRKEGFFWEYYAPQFISIYKKNKTVQFVNYISNNH